jgi:hypothetical protein
MYGRMNRRSELAIRGVTANLPAKLLDDACGVTGKGITDTLVLGLERVRRSVAASKARSLKGKLRLEVDLDVSRERSRH